MSRKLKYSYFRSKNILIFLIVLGFIIGTWIIFEVRAQKIEANLPEHITPYVLGLAEFSIEKILENKLAIIQGNSLLPISNHSSPEPQVIKRLRVIVTGYSSTVDQTDSDPFITAAGTLVREGMVATNILPFGSRIKLPELYGDKVFVVEDRMHHAKGYHIDIWFPNRDEALKFGAKITEVLILSN